MGRLDVRIVEARNLPNTETFGKPDSYVKLDIETSQHKSSVADSTLTPKWDEVFKFVIADPDSAQLDLKLWYKNLVSDTFVGQYKMPLSGLTKGVVKDFWVLLQQCKTNAEIHIRLLAHDFGYDPAQQQVTSFSPMVMQPPVIQPAYQQQQPVVYQQQQQQPQLQYQPPQQYQNPFRSSSPFSYQQQPFYQQQQQNPFNSELEKKIALLENDIRIEKSRNEQLEKFQTSKNAEIQKYRTELAEANKQSNEKQQLLLQSQQNEVNLQSDFEKLRQNARQHQRENQKLQNLLLQTQQNEKKLQDENEKLRRDLQEALKPKKQNRVSDFPRVPKASLSLGKELGSGVTCTVFESERNGVLSAAKLYSPHVINDRSVQREIKAAAFLQHPNIVAVSAIIVDDADASKSIGLLMERMGDNLGERVKNRANPPPLAQVLQWCVEVASAILCAFNLGVIHSDLKPENVMLTLSTPPVAKLTDFGAAHVMTTAASAVSAARGTPLFIAPEYSDGATGPTRASDMFSFGMTLWAVFHPHEDHGLGTNDLQIAKKIDKGERPKITNRQLPDPVKALIEKCWDHDPAKRPSIEKALQVLREAASTSPSVDFSLLWSERFLNQPTIASALAKLSWNRKDSCFFSSDVTDRANPLFQLVVSKLRPIPTVPAHKLLQPHSIKRVQFVQSDAAQLFLQLHEADGKSRLLNPVLSLPEPMDDPSQNALSKLRSVFEDSGVVANGKCRLLFGWHGTNARFVEQVCRDGPQSLRTTDAGFFAAGSYFALEAHYSKQYSEMMGKNDKNESAMILFCISISSAYPVTLDRDYRAQEDASTPELHGFSNFYSGDPTKAIALAPRCDAHFIPVKKYGNGNVHPLGVFDIVKPKIDKQTGKMEYEPTSGKVVFEVVKRVLDGHVGFNLDQQACDADDVDVCGHELVIQSHMRATPIAVVYF